MENFDDKDIATLLRLKRHEQPPPGYYENFLHEFHRRQRAELLKQPLWRLALQRAQDFMFQLNVSTFASYQTALAAVVVCAAVLSLKVYQTPETTSNFATITPHRQTPLPVSVPVDATWSLSSSPINARSLGSTSMRTANDSIQTHRSATPPRYVLDSTPVSYEPASFRF
jgi:hypothetical protein